MNTIKTSNILCIIVLVVTLISTIYISGKLEENIASKNLDKTKKEEEKAHLV